MNKAMLEQIKSTILEYNSENPDDQLTLLTQDEKIDVKNIFICTYNNNRIGIFEKISYHTNPEYRDKQIYYCAYDLYKGYNNSYTAIQLTKSLSFLSERWYDIGDSETLGNDTYYVNCKIQDIISFDEMRFMMYQQGKIETYTMGIATKKELLDVLKFAYNYYFEEKRAKRTRKLF